MVFSIAVQLVDGFGPVTYAAEPWTNYLLAWSWLLCGLWAIAFSSSEPRDQRAGIGFAAFLLASAAWSATGAVGIEASWRSVHNPWRVFAVGIPYSLFAGWLCVACVLNIAIAFKSFRYPPDYRCYTAQSAYTTRWEAEPADSKSWVSAVPLGTALLISVYAFLIPDPILPLPAAWGIANMKGHLKNWMAIELLLVTSVACAVESALDVWIWQ